MIRVGDLVVVKGAVPYGSDPPLMMARGWREYPGKYAFHKYVWTPGGTVGMLVEMKGPYKRILVGGEPLWFETYHIEGLEGKMTKGL